MNEDDLRVLQQVAAAFADEARPTAFTDHPGCSECEEHDETLRSKDRDTLTAVEVGSPAWDPITMATAEGWRYYLPSLCRIALEEPTYLEQLVFHLTGDGPGNRRVVACSVGQRAAIVDFLWHVLETREAELEDRDREDLLRAIEIWEAGTPAP